MGMAPEDWYEDSQGNISWRDSQEPYLVEGDKYLRNIGNPTILPIIYRNSTGCETELYANGKFFNQGGYMFPIPAPIAKEDIGRIPTNMFSYKYPNYATIDKLRESTYFDRWDHQVAMGILQGGSEALIGYGGGRAKRGLTFNNGVK